MKKLLAFAPFAMALLFTATAAYPQLTGPQRYSTALYLSVPPDKEAQFEDFYKTGAGMKAIKANMKADPKFLGWSLRRVVFGGNPSPRANYVIMSSREGAPGNPDPAKRDERYRTTVGMSYADYLAKARTMSQVVGNTLSHVHDLTPGYQMSEGDVVVVRRLKTTEGKNQELTALMRSTQLPIMAERVSEGALKGWAFSHLALAGGSSLPFDSASSSVYKDLASAVADGGPGGSNAGMARFAKLFPNRSYTRYLDDRRELSKLVRTDTYRVVVAIRP